MPRKVGLKMGKKEKKWWLAIFIIFLVGVPLVYGFMARQQSVYYPLSITRSPSYGGGDGDITLPDLPAWVFLLYAWYQQVNPIVSPYDFIISTNGTYYTAYYGSNNTVAYSGSNATTILQTCLDSLSSGGSIFIKDNLTLDGTVYINDSSVKIDGVAPSNSNIGTTLLRTNSQPIFVINGTSSDRIWYINMRDLVLDGNYQNGVLFVMNFTDRNYFENMNLQKGNNSGIELCDVWDTTFLSCAFVRLGNTTNMDFAVKDRTWELYPTDNINAIRFTNCRFECNDGDVYLGYAAHYNQFTNCKFHGFSTVAGHERNAGLYSVFLNLTNSNVFDSCYFIFGGTTATIYKITSTSANEDTFIGCVFTGNTTTPYYGTAIYSECRVIVEGCQFSKFENSVILQGSYTQLSLIDGNMFGTPTNSSIYLNTTYYITITDNQFYGITNGYGVRIENGLSYSVINDNRFWGMTYGINTTTVISYTEIYHNVFQSVSNPFDYSNAFGNNKVRENVGYITENQGVTATQDYATATDYYVSHSLVKTPTFVSLTFVNTSAVAFPSITITLLNSTMFAFRVDAAATGYFMWEANCY